MVKKSLNDRCPLQVECERKKCDFVHNELECPYYSANARDGYYIYDQEDIRNRAYREREEADFLASLEGEDDEAEHGSHIEKNEQSPHTPITVYVLSQEFIASHHRRILQTGIPP